MSALFKLMVVLLFTIMSNYQLSRLLGEQDPKLLSAQQVISWELVQSMRDDAVIKYESRRALASILSMEILKHATVTQREREDGLYFRVKVYVHSPTELQELLGKAFNLGQESAKIPPNYSAF